MDINSKTIGSWRSFNKRSVWTVAAVIFGVGLLFVGIAFAIDSQLATQIVITD